MDVIYVVDLSGMLSSATAWYATSRYYRTGVATRYSILPKARLRWLPPFGGRGTRTGRAEK